MKHLGIILASIILVLALGAEAKNPYAKQIKQLKKELAQIEKDLKHLEPFRDSTHPRIVRERERLQNEQIGVVEILQQLDPNGDYSAYLPKSDERSATGNDMTENRAEPEAAAEPEGAVSEVQSKANPNEEITLTVTSDGATKDEAIKNALRTAIEQAYGAFVSANTTILNDELVKDEIVTVSNGSIKEYKVLSEYEKADGSGYGVTANATVSLPHLITYAKNHGSECEFAGNTFGMEIKLFNLQKENELKALYNMIPVVENLCKATMHWELEVGEPQLMDISDDAYESMRIYIQGFSQSFGYPNWSTTPDEIREYLYKMRENPSDWCVVKFKLLWLPNLQYSVTDFKENRDFDPTKESGVMKYILDTLRELAPDDNTCESYRKKNIKYGFFDINGNGGIPLRNTDDVIEWTKVLCSTIESVKNNFVIVDNTGQRSDFNPTLIKDFKYDSVISYDNDIRYKGTGIFKPVFMIGESQCSHFGYWLLDRPYFLIDKKGIKETDEWKVTRTYQYEGGGHILYVFIPISEIGKYSSFKIEPIE